MLVAEASDFLVTLVFYNDITNLYKNEWRHYPPPDDYLARMQATILYCIQMHSFTNPHRLAVIMNRQCSPNCQNCSLTSRGDVGVSPLLNHSCQLPQN